MAISVASSLVSGGAVAFMTLLATRVRTRAEAEKLLAEAEMLRTQTLQLTTTASLVSVPGPMLPTGWKATGSRPDCYAFGIENAFAHTGARCVSIASRPEEQGFGSIIQSFYAKKYLGKRLHLSGFLKVEGVENVSCMWMRVDGADGELLGFDNMSDRPVGGTRDWVQCHIVLDVLESASRISFGVFLKGRGKVWVDDFRLTETVDLEPTAREVMPPMRFSPQNLSFES